MSARLSRIALVVFLVLGTGSVSTRQRPSTPQRAGGATANTATGRAVAAAEAFLATLDETQRAKANIGLNDTTRTVWSNLPSGMKMQVGAAERNGLKLAVLNPAQEKAALALVSSVLSREGYDKAMAVVEADQVLET